MTETTTFPYAGMDVEIEVEIEPRTQGLWHDGRQVTPDEGGVTATIKSITISDDNATYYDITAIVRDQHPKVWDEIETEAYEQAEKEYGES